MHWLELVQACLWLVLKIAVSEYVRLVWRGK